MPRLHHGAALGGVDDALIAEIEQFAPSQLEVSDRDGDGSLEVIIKHLYIERRMIPLNIYLQEAFDAGGASPAADGAAAVRARAQIDLALVSVLLDAGAGPDWRFHDARSGQVYARSEGLGVASFNAFCKGLFSSKPTQPCQADAAGLQAVTARALGEAFQVAKDNPLVGLEGRAALLRRLGAAIDSQPEVFGGAGGQCRPGRLYDHLTVLPGVAAHDILAALLSTLSGIWPAQNTLQSGAEALPLGDCWRHSAVGGSVSSTNSAAGSRPCSRASAMRSLPSRSIFSAASASAQ